jgi:hypothetical protein
VTPSFLHVASTNRKHASVTSPLDFLWSVFKPSLKVCWIDLIPVRSTALQATTAPCLYFKPLDLLSRSLMFAFVHAQEDFLF